MDANAFASHQLILRQRSTQAFHASSDEVNFLRRGFRADLAPLGHRDDSYEDHAEHKDRDHNQPGPSWS